MAAPAELTSESAPESVAPEPVAAESADQKPTAPQPRVPEPAEAVPDPELMAAEPDPELVAGELTEAELDEYAEAELDEHVGAELDDYAEPELDEYAEPELDEYAEAELDEDVGAGEDARRGRGVGWLVTAAVAVVVIGLAAAVGALAVTTHGFRSKTIVTYRPAAVFRLRAGDCIDSSQNGPSVTILSCASPHEAEVFATFSLTGSSWPGSGAIKQQASGGCANRMASYVNPALAEAGLTQEYVYPDLQAWQAGVRTVVCEVSAASGQLTGSVRQAG
jgi:hypothetical protein